MDFQEIGWAGMNWIDLTENRDNWGIYEHSNQPLGSIKCGEFLDELRNSYSISRRTCSMELISYLLFK
jgi:hypothetical protein